MFKVIETSYVLVRRLRLLKIENTHGRGTLLGESGNGTVWEKGVEDV